MSLLFRHLRVHHIFGANTDVGKTVLTTALVRAAARTTPVHYLKPVSTGPLADADTAHIARHAPSDRVHTECLYQYDHPVSPHLAARLADRPPVADHTLVNAIASHVRRIAHASTLPARLFVETAGGVHSPTLSGSTQADAFRPLFLPTILIGDPNLGGISTTIAAYEALLLRGYILDAVLLFRDDYYRNAEYLAQYFAHRGVWLAHYDKPPPRHPDPVQDRRDTESYYERASESILDTVHHLNNAHTNRLAELDSMPQRSLNSIWWPFVQHAHINNVNVIDSAHGDFFSVYSPSPQPTRSLLSPQLDSSASWWTQTFGHAHTSLTLAAARAAGRYGHVMFPGATHLPALRLSEALLDGPGRGWAHRVFISDNGSTGMEVAIKMALRARVRTAAPNPNESLGVLGLTASYHGDTIGAMDMCEPGVYTCEWHDAKGVWLDPPTVAFRNARLAVTSSTTTLYDEFDSLAAVYDVEARLRTPLATVYREHVENVLRRREEERARAGGHGMRLAALVLEPLVMGAGGMKFVDPLFQRVMIDVVRSADPELGLCPPHDDDDGDGWRGLPVIFDEVFVGLYRLGLERTAPLLGAFPDIAVNAKVLTGGLVPLATTMAREGVFRAFWGPGKEEALLHGHSYSAHAVGCEVAVETLGQIAKMAREQEGPWVEARGMWGAPPPLDADAQGEKSVWSFWDPGFVRRLSEAESVEEVMTLGCVLAIRVADTKGGYTSHAAQELLAPLADLHRASDAEDARAAATQAPGGAPYSVHYRTLGNVAYFMTSLNTRAEVVREVEDRIWGVLG
ncbi:hypothetical protein H0H87_005055 [Tephrocybe sp. NHM501043]|nr:hypothetical protein H0H87_005055 [Tephrocybe sp. NHM501043]